MDEGVLDCQSKVVFLLLCLCGEEKRYLQKLKALWKFPKEESCGVASVVRPLLHFVPAAINGLIACCNSLQSLLYR